MNGSFPTEISLAHLQGYLYVQQSIQTTARCTQGTVCAYGLALLEDSGKTLEQQVLKMVINLFYDGYLDEEELLFRENIQTLEYASTFTKLAHWRMDLMQKLERWFIDDHIRVNYCGTASQDRQQRQSNKDVMAQERTNRFREMKYCTKDFVGCLAGYLQDKQVEVWEWEINAQKLESLANNQQFPFLLMAQSLGLEYSLFIIKSKAKNLFLHLGLVTN